MNRQLQTTFALSLCLAAGMTAHAQYADPANMGCGSLEVGYGPYDYTNPVHFREKLPIVERGHFTHKVENLIGGESGSNLMGDIKYTLDRFPNHHRALYSMIRYYAPREDRPTAGRRMSPECWFDRAMRFKPDDATVRMLYGIYLHKISKPEAALERYEEALALIPNSAELHYNMGLTYFELDKFDKAYEHAMKAYELGYPLPGLRSRLASVGKWPTEQ